MNAKETLVKHAMICAGISLAISLLLLFSGKAHVGFLGHVAWLLSGTVFTTIGVSIGEAIRRFVQPDMILTTDAMDTFRKKVFWRVGPQVIGWIIGYIATMGFLRNVLGMSQF